jgi:hypothetical protein
MGILIPPQPSSKRKLATGLGIPSQPTNGMHSAGLRGTKAGKLGGVGSAAKKIETCNLPNSLAAQPQ